MVGLKMPAPEEIKKLVQRYKDHRDQYKSSGYKETELRREFLDPMFTALGWDVDNKQGYAEQYKEVVHEQSLDVEGDTRAPDYSFRIGGVRKFFVEAKKPSVSITSDKKPAFQLRRYAWSAKLPLSILTNFEDFYVYDCRIKPDKNDAPDKSRILYISWDELEERWDELFAIFTKESILKGSFDKYAQAKKRGTSEVDAEILKDIEGWREELAKNIAIQNPDLTIEEMNFAVGRLIDRILFLRICEDRGTEPENQLLKIYETKKGIYRHLIDVFQLADAKYNSGLFHFTHDKERSTKADRITPNIKVDDRVLASIIWDLYYPNSPYQFDVIPADILGQVYEQFLGKVIRLTAGHHAKVEEKPEVKKAGGVYYTPTYIVDYIVENTVVKLCEGKNPEEMKKLKILDPACGSGSFLIVAYKRLMDKHLEWYMANNPKKYKDEIFQNHKGAWQLTLQEKKKILLSSIHGVDIDSQAVEVTKLNLLLKALEGESRESIDNVQKWFREPALPDLGSNIKCGNSLIDFDIIDHLQDLSDDERDAELARINPFNWQEEFSGIMKGGGFDAVVGNPPYIRIQTMKEWAPIEVEHYKKIYQSASKGNYDIYVVFIEKGLSILNPTGKLGFIQPHKFFNAKYGEAIREVISNGKHLFEVVHFSDQQVFENATTYTCLMFLEKGGTENLHFVKVDDLNAWRLSGKCTEGMIPASSIGASEWNFTVGDGAVLFEKLSKMPVKLGQLDVRIFQGIITGADAVFILKKDGNELFSKAIGKNVIIEKEIIKPLLKGQEIHRYGCPLHQYEVIFPYEIIAEKAHLISEKNMHDKYSKTTQYFEMAKHLLNSSDRTKKSILLHEFSRHQNIDTMPISKIILQVLASAPSFIYDEFGQYAFVGGGTAGGYGIISKDSRVCHKYLLGLLNSRLLFFYHKRIATPFGGGFFAYSKQYLEQLPIRTIDFSNKEDVARHDKMVKLVERMLRLHKDLKEASNVNAERVEREIRATDGEIDRLVYELYGLTQQEIGVVEGET